MKTKLFLLTKTDFASLDKSLQEEVYQDFYKLVYGVSIQIIHDHSTAEDIVQEAFMKTIYNAPNIENEQQLIGWIRVVTKNLTFNVIRKNKKIRNQDDIESVINNDVNNQDESVEKKVEVKMMEENISKSILEINSEYQNIIESKWINDKSNKDIAKEQNATEGAIKQKLHRARKALKQKMKKWGFQDE
ncbi:sigma-70 family RNA polymerase sigma factor [Aquibacillus sp. 3ASR75-11]|uniref:Sigma-70 family RNA polymerase sigma factor n=1 Tax=Terrihalobacillus insolitus TaxID=2950438 RepID=A0A9X3WSC6_9BACI|nr:sigma-70 family RNA polymerase sigma factor [Terrihalobacillus insolitus]MDC3425097.1 sigma-70 family RNA polymerase sigma factor [Terrihalobacillus insolitus]